MYTHILVAIENSVGRPRRSSSTCEQLATLTGASLLLVHVADGWAARHFDELKLRESEEIKDDRAYLDQLCQELVASAASTCAPAGDGRSGDRAVKVAQEEQVDLIAMSTHGHRFLNDLMRGSTADRVRHNVTMPVLMVRA